MSNVKIAMIVKISNVVPKLAMINHFFQYFFEKNKEMNSNKTFIAIIHKNKIVKRALVISIIEEKVLIGARKNI